MIAVYNQEKSPRSMKGVWSMELGWGLGDSEVRFSGTRFRAVAGNTYVLADLELQRYKEEMKIG